MSDALIFLAEWRADGTILAEWLGEDALIL
jgi:hypothetical protein